MEEDMTHIDLTDEFGSIVTLIAFLVALRFLYWLFIEVPSDLRDKKRRK